MYNNLVFIGGIHGVGKSTICKKVCKLLRINHLSASEVLKWSEINDDNNNKNVKDIDLTQDRLIIGLNHILKNDEKYILDGHFCLFNAEGEVSRINMNTFITISPIAIYTVIGNTNEIAERLSKRDNKTYNSVKLAFMQEEERKYGKIIAEQIKVPYSEIAIDDSDILINNILNLFANESPT